MIMIFIESSLSIIFITEKIQLFNKSNMKFSLKIEVKAGSIFRLHEVKNKCKKY